MHMHGAPSERKSSHAAIGGLPDAHGPTRATKYVTPQHCVTEPVRLYMRDEVSTTAVGSLLPNYVNAKAMAAVHAEAAFFGQL